MSNSDLTPREYAEKHKGWGEWRDTRVSFHLYRHAAERFEVKVQRHSELGYGLDHTPNIEEEKTLGKEFVELFCHYLSIADMESIIHAMSEEVAAWRDRRETQRLKSPWGDK